MNRPVYRSLRIHVAGALVTASQLRDESTEDGHRAAFEGCLFHLGQCARILDDVADVDTVAAAQRDLDALRAYAAQREAEGHGALAIVLTRAESVLLARLDPAADRFRSELMARAQILADVEQRRVEVYFADSSLYDSCEPRGRS